MRLLKINNIEIISAKCGYKVVVKVAGVEVVSCFDNLEDALEFARKNKIKGKKWTQ